MGIASCSLVFRCDEKHLNICIVGPTLWHSELSCHMKCLHPIRVPVQFLVLPLYTQFMINVPGKAAENGPCTHMKYPYKSPGSWLLALDQPRSSHCRFLRNESWDEQPLWLSISLSLTVFQINPQNIFAMH